jgi:endogenous inhibitor of DNA gyrase (YacG/DUF329 family)
MKNLRVGLNCPFCGKTHFVDVNDSEYKIWQAGALIQKAMPQLSATEREQLISHMCPKCQADFYGEED